MADPLRLQVNGSDVECSVAPRTLLLDLLRDHLGLTGTHEGCAYGACGACTVIVDGKPARSCLTLAVQVRDADVRTVEGLAAPGEMTEIQQAFHEQYGLQCGFCTPGLLCSLTAFIEQTDGTPTPDALEAVISGHLCRCTGYVGIRRAARRAVGLPADRTEDDR